MIEKQYEYYRKETSTLIFYSLGIVVAFAITFSLNHADGKHILKADWMSRQRDVGIAAFYVFIFIIAWIFYFVALSEMDNEMRIIRKHLLSVGKINDSRKRLLERSKSGNCVLGSFYLLAAYF